MAGEEEREMGKEGRGEEGEEKGMESDPPSSFMLIPTLVRVAYVRQFVTVGFMSRASWCICQRLYDPRGYVWVSFYPMGDLVLGGRVLKGLRSQGFI